MAITNEEFRHDHAGARWLAPFAIAMLAVLGVLYFMLVYPHVSV